MPLDNDSKKNVEMKKLLNKDIIAKWNNDENIDWRQLTKEGKGEWLLACLFTTGLPNGTLEKKDYKIDGDEIKEHVDLYCILGQTFMGEKGYMGQDLDGLHDCFLDLKVLPGTMLTIKNHDRLASVLRKRFDNYFEVLVDTLKEHGLILKLE
jgi:RNAse (barnase) inhibitor barstar